MPFRIRRSKIQIESSAYCWLYSINTYNQNIIPFSWETSNKIIENLDKKLTHDVLEYCMIYLLKFQLISSEQNYQCINRPHRERLIGYRTFCIFGSLLSFKQLYLLILCHKLLRHNIVFQNFMGVCDMTNRN